jgi:hypothetical protein
MTTAADLHRRHLPDLRLLQRQQRQKMKTTTTMPQIYASSLAWHHRPFVLRLLKNGGIVRTIQVINSGRIIILTYMTGSP